MKKNAYTYIPESLCCTAEIKILIKKFKKHYKLYFNKEFS